MCSTRISWLWISNELFSYCNPLIRWEISYFFGNIRFRYILNNIRLPYNKEPIWSCSICTCQRMDIRIAVIKNNSIGVASNSVSHATLSFFPVNNTRNQCGLWILSCWAASNDKLLLIWRLLTNNHILSSIEILNIHAIFTYFVVWRGICISRKYIITSGVAIVAIQLQNLLRDISPYL